MIAEPPGPLTLRRQHPADELCRGAPENPHPRAHPERGGLPRDPGLVDRRLAPSLRSGDRAREEPVGPNPGRPRGPAVAQERDPLTDEISAGEAGEARLAFEGQRVEQEHRMPARWIRARRTGDPGSRRQHQREGAGQAGCPCGRRVFPGYLTTRPLRLQGGVNQRRDATLPPPTGARNGPTVCPVPRPDPFRCCVRTGGCRATRTA